MLTPHGIYADLTAAKFFKSASTNGQVSGLYDFENGRTGSGLPPFFQDVHRSFKFCALIFGGEERTFAETRCGFFLNGTSAIDDPVHCFPLSPEDFARVNPNTGTAPVFRSRRDADITRSIYERHPVLVDRSSGQEVKAWPVKYMNMFHMANDSHLFRTREILEENEGAYPIGGNCFNSPTGKWVPLYEGKMVQAFDHRAADTTVNEENLFRPGQQETIPTTEKQDFDRLPMPRYFIQLNETRWISDHDWIIAFKNVTATTNIRTMIAAIIPKVGAGHSLNLLTASENLDSTPRTGCLIVANLNAFVFDFVARQKVPGNNFTLYLLEQLPVIKHDNYDRSFGEKSASKLICDHVLRLSYTSHDMTPFARDLGYDGPPFTWDEDERLHLRARLDALYFHLYGLTREDASYVLDTFPIVRRKDEAEFGRYRTKDLVLAYMNALAAGDTETIVAV